MVKIEHTRGPSSTLRFAHPALPSRTQVPLWPKPYPTCYRLRCKNAQGLFRDTDGVFCWPPCGTARLNRWLSVCLRVCCNDLEYDAPKETDSHPYASTEHSQQMLHLRFVTLCEVSFEFSNSYNTSSPKIPKPNTILLANPRCAQSFSVDTSPISSIIFSSLHPSETSTCHPRPEPSSFEGYSSTQPQSPPPQPQDPNAHSVCHINRSFDFPALSCVSPNHVTDIQITVRRTHLLIDFPAYTQHHVLERVARRIDFVFAFLIALDEVVFEGLVRGVGTNGRWV